jgi:preprotein translocase subunit SecY
MLEMLRNAWKVKELRNKMIYTVLMLLVYRVGAILPVPGVNVQAIGDAISGNGVLELFNMFNGGALANFTIFATGVTPYITASIVMQLLTVAIPKLEQLSKEGEEGRRKINKITRYVGIAMAFVTSIGTMIGFGATILNHPVWYNYLFIAVIHTAGTAFTIWLGDRISSKGIGNGISLLIFINIISSIPTQIGSIARNMSEGVISYWLIPVFIVVVVAIIVAVVFVDLGERRITVQYAKRVVGRKLYGGQSTHIPLKVNNTGVMPLIFAMTIMQFPALIMMFWPNASFTLAYQRVMHTTSPLYLILQTVFIIFFAYFYSAISFNPVDVSKNIQQNGGFIPGIRPGKPTSDHLARISNRITMFSAVFMALLALVPTILTGLLPTGIISGFTATSILIVVSVALETSKQLEAQLMMRHYKGFLK